MLYDTNKVVSLEEIGNSKEMLEMLILDDVLRGDAQSIHEFAESEGAKVLQEKSVLKKGTMMRLSKVDDAHRREKLAVYALAKAAKDPLYTKLKLHIKAKKQLTAKLMKKYGTKAKRIADIGQKQYIKTAAALPNTPAKK